MSIQQCKLVEFPTIEDPRGNLTFIESTRHIPFEIRRVYYVYDVPNSANRGAHGHAALRQILIAINGSFTVHLDDARDQRVQHLSAPNVGLYLSPMIWRDITDFSEGAVCMVLASDFYDEKDYFRNYDSFRKAVESGKG